MEKFDIAFDEPFSQIDVLVDDEMSPLSAVDESPDQAADDEDADDGEMEDEETEDEEADNEVLK